ncbi:MAG TPA: hypothetical protein VMD97_06415 [Candidatus Aquilonibacter sp.]|nr:hypothetical protein [Candidatus Aquilonibacter sp.]
MSFAAGCESSQQKAIDQAKSQAASTQTPQQVQYIDSNGNTVTKIVQPPVNGQPGQISTTVTTPPPGTKPQATPPVITPLGTAPSPASNQAAYDAAQQQTATAPEPQPTNAAPVQPGTPPPYNLTVPAGTELAVRVNQRIDVKHAVAGEHFTGEIVEPVMNNGVVLIPRGTPVRGRIDESHRRGHFKGRSVLELRLVSMTLNGYEYGLDTHDTVRSKRGKGRRSAGFIGGLAGVGMLVGGIASGGAGLAIGGASGAGAGTLLAGVTGNRDIVIPAESIVHFRLADQLVVQNP